MNKIIIFILLAPLSVVKASEFEAAKITGASYFGVTGKVAKIKFGNQSCSVSSRGKTKNNSFKIEFTCNGITQVLWDMNVPVVGDFNLDDPKFYLLWAGDKDSDGKIDIVMDMSPKYSCSKEIIYLSSEATKDQLVGISGYPETVCG